MSEDTIDVASNEQPKKRGRPAIATKETVAEAVEQLKGDKARVTVRGIMRVLDGGSPNTISDLLKQLPDARPSITPAATVPESLIRVWKTSVAESIKNLFDEYEQKLQAAADEVKGRDGDIYDLEARVIELETALAEATTERDLARGERDQLREEVLEARQVASSHLERAQMADEMINRAQVAELKADEVEQSHAALQEKLTQTREENIRLRGQIDGLLQARQLAPAVNAISPANALDTYTDTDDGVDDDDVPL